MNVNTTDLEIISELKGDLSNGARLLFEKYYEPLKNYGMYSFNLSLFDAEEFAADTIIEVYESIEKFQYKHPNSFRNWVFKILRNKVLDFFKKNNSNKLLRYNEGEMEREELISAYSQGNSELLRQTIISFTSEGTREDMRKEIIYETLNDFNDEEKEDLLAHFNNMDHRASSEYRKTKYDAYRQRISRLVKSFFEKIGIKINNYGKEINERYKEINS